MLIVERYERVINYLYPIIQTIPNQHKIAKDLFLENLFSAVGLFYQAGKLNQISKLYQIDSILATVRFWLRFFVNPKIKGLTEHQKQTAETLLGEVGSLLSSWMKKLNKSSKVES